MITVGSYHFAYQLANLLKNNKNQHILVILGLFIILQLFSNISFGHIYIMWRYR